MNKNNITVRRGNNHYVKLNIDVNGNPYVISGGDTVHFTVKTCAGGNALLKKQLTASDINGEGELILALEPRDTIELKAGNYVYDAAVILGGKFFTFIPPSPFNVMNVITEEGDCIE